MKIKRYFAPDMRQAIRMVREEQGPDAVILSNRKVNGGVEIVAAIDYDEALVNQAMQGEPVTPAAPRAPAAARAATPPAAAAADAAPGGARPAPAATPTAPRGGASIVWAQDPALTAMQDEIRQLRSLLETELAQLAWGDMARRQPLRAAVLGRLGTLGIDPTLAEELADQAAAAQDAEHAWRLALGALAHRLPVTEDDIIGRGGVVALVGATGVGKTTMVAKLAARYALRHGQRHVGLVTTDSYRIGAHEQLLTYGRILGVPVQLAGDARELRAALDNLADKDLILVDTAGMSQRDLRLSEQLGTLTASATAIRSYLVMSATSQTAVMDEAARAFGAGALQGCILTKLDEAAALGGALSVAVRHSLPIAYVGDGQRVPEDVHLARPHTLVTRAVSLLQTAGQQAGHGAPAGDLGGMTANAHV